jgi:trans-aconitate methyltransferase
MPDARTIAAYDAHAADYDNRFRTVRPDRHLKSFIEALPKGARVLDLGCGPANASVLMRDAGLQPDAVDASPAMVALANDHHAIGARLATFDDIVAKAAYEGIWANFSLLHAPRADLPRYLRALHEALVAGGLLHLGMKIGTGERRDALDRHYTYVSRDELRRLVSEAGFDVTATDEGNERGLAGTLDPFIVLRANA